MVLVEEWGDITRFRTAMQAAAYTGLTTKVEQSGEHCHHGHITKQVSSWMRWILVGAAMKIIQKDIPWQIFTRALESDQGPRTHALPKHASWPRFAGNDCTSGIVNKWQTNQW